MTDDDLRERFSELRASERKLVRPFAARRRPRRHAWWLVPVTALLVIAVVLISRHDAQFSPADRAAAQQLAAWHAPTDGLLATPGRELLASTPTIPEIPKGVPR